MWLRRKRLSLTILILGVGLAACSKSASTSTSSTRPTHVTPSTTSTVPSTATTPIPTTTTPPAPADAHLTISSTDWTVGELVTVTGTGCPVGHWGEAELYGGPNAPAILDGGGMFDVEMYFLTSSGDMPGGTVATTATGR